MSLLNDMLKDLDKKKSRHQSVTLSLNLAKDSLLKPFISILLIASLIFLAVFFLNTRLSQNQSPFIHKSASLVPEQTQTVKNNSSAKPEPSLVEDEQTKATDTLLDKHVFEASEPENTNELAQLTQEEWQEEHMNLALEAIQEGNDRHAMALLDLVLSKFPTSIEARENLAALYYSQGDIDNAYRILNEGLQLTPHNLNLTVMKARFLVEEGEYHKALGLLTGYNPDIKTKPEFYALLAAIYESIGQTNEAGGLYQSLVKVDPSNGQYWLGLGLAFEHKTLHTQAIEAYKRASQSENIPASGRSYAENRLHTLQG